MSVSPMYQTILTKTENEIFYITINRESKLNALSIALLISASV